MNNNEIKEMLDGNNTRLYDYFGAHLIANEIRFRVYAPNAKNVFVLGSFNEWNKYQYLLTKNEYGIWEITIPITDDFTYLYLIEDQQGNKVEKVDPFCMATQLEPNYVSKFHNLLPQANSFVVENKDKLNIYEVFLGSFKQTDDKQFLNYNELCEVVDYACIMNYNMLEFLPLTEHPFTGSWGYQANSFFAPTARYGEPMHLHKLINYAHTKKIGCIFDFVLGHFCSDQFGLENFDGQPLFETGTLTEWGTHNFDFSNGFVRSFLKSAILFWLREYHFDGIRIDAVSHLIYHNGKAENGENIAAISFLREINDLIKQEFNNTKLMFAEDSSTYPKITKPTADGGLGFDYKWNLGWMNDLLQYYQTDPLYRKDIFSKLTFSFHYMYSEKYLLPFSHDEVVHLKKSMLEKMHGISQVKFANLRSLYAHMYAHPGAKLNFMGNDIAVFEEFDELKQINWSVLERKSNYNFQHFIRTLGALYIKQKPLHELCTSYEGFEYVFENIADNVLMYRRYDSKNNMIQVVLNTSGVDYYRYLIPVRYQTKVNVLLNSESFEFGGNNEIDVVYQPDNNKVIFSNLPAFSTIYFAQKNDYRAILLMLIKKKVTHKQFELTLTKNVSTKTIKQLIEEAEIEEYYHLLKKVLIKTSDVPLIYEAFNNFIDENTVIIKRQKVLFSDDLNF